MTSSAQLEREAEQTRAQLAQTLDELRERITPGQLVDQAVDYAKDSGGGLFVRNLGQQATANPLPVALIGAGVAWLMLSNGRQQSAKAASINRAAETAIDSARQTVTETTARVAEVGRKTSDQIKQFGQDASQRASDWMSDTSDRITDARERFRERADATRSTAEYSSHSAAFPASEAVSPVRDRASSAYETAKSQASETYGRVTDQAKQATSSMASGLSGFGQRTAGASRDLLQFCKSEPLVLAGIGMALGAIAGTLIPPTETEDQLMGKTSDQIKGQVREAAENQYEKAETVVEGALNQAENQFQFQPSGNAEQSETGLVPGVEETPSPVD